VVDKFMKELIDQLAEKNVRIALTDDARRYLAEKGYDKTFGARPMARLIQSEVKQVLADEILFGQLQNGGRVEIDLGEDGLVFRYEPRPADETAEAAPAESVPETVGD